MVSVALLRFMLSFIAAGDTLILGSVDNDKHTISSSTEIHERGESFFDFISTNNLSVFLVLIQLLYF